MIAAETKLWLDIQRSGIDPNIQLLDQLVRGELDSTIERLFSENNKCMQARIIRLFHQSLDGLDYREFPNVNQPFECWFAEIIQALALTVVKRLAQYFERTPDDLFVQSVIRKFSFGIEPEMVMKLSLKMAMEQLAIQHPLMLRCINLKYFLGHSLKEIGGITRLTTQQVRTQLSQGEIFLKEHL